MTVQMERRDQFIKPLTSSQKISGKQFDSVLILLQEYANDFGLSEDDLDIVTKACLTQQIAMFRLKKLMKTLIPIAYVSETSIRNAIKWLLAQLNKTNKPLLGVKYVLQWISGILEYDLDKTKVINKYYDLFYYYLDKDNFNVPACKIIYLLTKPSDVNRWYVKQVLRIHEKYCKPKYTSALLYLFKMYRPDCVPENIRAYVVHKIFGSLPESLIQGFTRARNNIIQNNDMSKNADSIIWIQLKGRKNKKGIQLIPSIAENEVHLNTHVVGYKSLLSISNASDLHKYHLSSSYPKRAMSLINNSAGFHLLAFYDINLHSKLSYQLYYTLRDAFLEANQFVSEDEKINLLNQISILQIHMQQSVPVVSKFLAEYIIRWDGYEYESQIYRLLRWLHIVSFHELRDCILNFLFTIFISSTVTVKCKILGFLGDIACNMIITYANRIVNERTGLFLNIKQEWTIHDIEALYEYIEAVCNMGLYLQKGHSVLMDSIIHLHYKIIKAEIMCDMEMFNISTILMYRALFSSNPNNLIRVCDLIIRYPKYISDSVKQDFLNSLYCKYSTSVSFADIEKLKEIELLFEKLNVNESFDWTRHFALTCYNYKMLGKIDPVQDIKDFLNYAQIKYPSVCLFLRNTAL